MDSNKYVMSLDLLDIALLPTQSLRMNNNIAPLWTANNFTSDSDRYFEFNIVTESERIESNCHEVSNNDNNTESTPRKDIVKSYCHICDIDIPAAYINDHENSLKHKAYVKIADAVLERTRKHMLKKNCGSVEKDNTMYFCKSCSTVVRVVDKNNHEKTKDHKQSLSLDRLLYELVALYTNDFNETEEEYATVTTNLSVDNENEEKVEFDTNLNNNNTVLISDMKACLDEYDMKTVESHVTKVTNVQKPNECNIKDGILQNGFVSNSHTSSNMLDVFEVLTNTNVKVRPEAKAKPVGNNTNSYSAIKQTSSDTYYCSPCNIIIHTNNIDSHVKGKKHAWLSKSDLHYLLKQEEGVNDLLCKICNIYIPDDSFRIKEHVATNDHIKKYKNHLKSNYVIQQKENYFCKPCDMDIINRNELCHIEKINHEIKLASFKEITAELLTMEQNTNMNGSISSVSTVQQKLDSHYCTICDVYIPNRTSNIKDHYDGARHKKNIGNIANGIADAVEDRLDTSSNLYYHMEATENEKELRCKACKSIVPSKKENLTEHIKGKRHESCLQKIVDENHLEVIGEEYTCRLCKHTVSVQDLFSHINKKRHINLLNVGKQTQVKSEIATTNNNTNVAINQQKDNNTTVSDKKGEPVDSTYMKFKYHFTENKETNQFICKVCNNLNIPNTTLDLVNHASDEKHLIAYENLIIDNLIFEIENNTYFCGICLCLVPLNGEVHHLRGGRHTENYTSALSKVECDLCNTNSIKNMSSHLISAEHTLRLLKNQSLVHYCEYCETLLLKSFVDDHIKSCHKMATKDKICFCTVCDPFLPGCSGTK